MKKKIKDLAKFIFPRTAIQRLKIELQDFKKNPPILIFSMGKTGTSTVTASLNRAGLSNPIYRIHRLSHEGIKKSEEKHRTFKKTEFSDVLKLSKILRNKIDKRRGIQDISWKIISLTREPVAMAISTLFQSIENHHPELIDENGKVRINKALELLHDQFENYDESSNYPLVWFDRELKAVFNVDAYAYPFNHKDGFIIIRKENIEVLIMKTEFLNYSFNKAITQFLNVNSSIEMVLANIGEEKKFCSAYSYIKRNIIIPKAVCEKIYSSKYAKHFYPKSQSNELIQKWSREKNEKFHPD